MKKAAMLLDMAEYDKKKFLYVNKSCESISQVICAAFACAKYWNFKESIKQQLITLLENTH